MDSAVANNPVRVARRRNGVTLIETMIAVFVLAMCTAGAMAIILQARRMSDRARSRYIAVNVAKNRIERGRTFSFPELPLLAESNVVVNSSGSPDLSGEFRRTTRVSSVTSNLVEMAVTVEIKNRITLKFDGAKEAVSSYIADYRTGP